MIAVVNMMFRVHVLKMEYFGVGSKRLAGNRVMAGVRIATFWGYLLYEWSVSVLTLLAG
jgi:hypothetical protein